MKYFAESTLQLRQSTNYICYADDITIQSCKILRILQKTFENAFPFFKENIKFLVLLNHQKLGSS